MLTTTPTKESTAENTIRYNDDITHIIITTYIMTHIITTHRSKLFKRKVGVRVQSFH